MNTLRFPLNKPAVDRLIADAKALIFDCDGTLVNSAPVYAKAWAAGFASAGATMDAAWYHERNGLSEHLLIDSFEQQSGLTLNRDQVIRRVHEAFVENLEALSEMAFVADIARAAEGRIPLAVASGGPAAIVHLCLEKLGLLHLFDTVVTIDDVGVPKPGPDLFLRAAQLLSIPATQCLVFEDSEPGTLAARNAGMQCIDIRTVQR